MVGYFGGSVQRIYASLVRRNDNHQFRMIEVEGKIVDKTIDILIDSRARNSYIAPNLG